MVRNADFLIISIGGSELQEIQSLKEQKNKPFRQSKTPISQN